MERGSTESCIPKEEMEKIKRRKRKEKRRERDWG